MDDKAEAERKIDVNKYDHLWGKVQNIRMKERYLLKGKKVT